METKQDKREKIKENIKSAGSVAIYIGTASMMKPVVQRGTADKNPLTKLCGIFSGTVVSCGISHYASRWFGAVVDKMSDFIDEVRKPPKVKEGDIHG